MKTNHSPSGPEVPAPTTGQLVSGPMLLDQLFAPACRPTLRWLQAQRKAGRLPCFKIGQLVFFDPAAVRAAFASEPLSRPVPPAPLANPPTGTLAVTGFTPAKGRFSQPQTPEP